MNNIKKEIKKLKLILFITASKRINYLEINLPNEEKDLSTEHYKTLMKELNKTQISKMEELI